MHIEMLHGPVWQGALNIGELLCLTISIDLFNTGAQLHWPVKEVEIIEGTADVLRQDIKRGARLPVAEKQVALQIQHHLRHWDGINGRIPQADMAHEVVPH